jgi:hypothetical protein
MSPDPSTKEVAGNLQNSLLVPSGTPSVNLNEVIQQALASLQRKRSKLIIRCSELPSVEGSLTHWQELFCLLVKTIEACNSKSARTFLQIDTEKVQEKPAVQGYPVIHYTQIHFYTNLQPTTVWLQQQEPVFAKSRQYCEMLKASLVLNNASQSGCIFSIKIPVHS